ncbi:MAG TPA: IclR family transcriptional regulator [Candidatus Methylomirabilis sp.]|nr:IclR family transcriptional regulator [Candidatus Methylomirabilis sp.]
MHQSRARLLLPRRAQSTPGTVREPGRRAAALRHPRKPRTRKEAAGSVRSLERALDLLETLESLRSPSGARALEAATGIPKATAQRLLDVLERRGYAQKGRGRYYLGPGVVRLARGFHAGDSLATIALPVLQRLTALSSETCSLYLRQGFDRIIVQRVESPHPLRQHTAIGERLPLHIGASGQILCGGMPDELLRQYLEALPPVRLAAGKTLSKKELWARCQQARLRGFAVGVDERWDGVSSVAAPVTQKNKGVVAAINIAGPSSRMPVEKLEQLSLEVRSAAQEISEKLDQV